MKFIKKINPFWAFIAIILVWRLYKDFDFQTFKFAKIYLDIVFLIVFILSIYFLIIEFRKATIHNEKI